MLLLVVGVKVALSCANDMKIPSKIFEHEGYVVFCEPSALASGRFLAQALVRSTADEWGRGFYALGEFDSEAEAITYARAWSRCWIDSNMAPDSTA